MKMTFRPIDTWPGDLLDVNDRTDPLVRICDVRVTDVYREPLFHIGPSDVAAEGFPDWTPAQFIDFYCRTFKVTPETIVTRIEWRYLEP